MKIIRKTTATASSRPVKEQVRSFFFFFFILLCPILTNNVTVDLHFLSVRITIHESQWRKLYVTLHREMSCNAVARNLLQGSENVDFEILVVTA